MIPPMLLKYYNSNLKSTLSHCSSNVWMVFCCAGVMSLLVSLLVTYRTDVINLDGICYLNSAAMLKIGGLRKAMNLCSQSQWPLYSVLIYYFAHLSHCSLEHSAYILDALCSGITVLTFIQIVRQLGGNIRVLWFAALIILSSHECNIVKQYLIRDHGFWAGYLLSISFLLAYVKTPRNLYALGWSISLLVAGLFRIEGLIFWGIIPLVIIFWVPTKSRLYGLCQLYWLPLGLGVSLCTWLIFHPEVSLASLGRLPELVTQLLHFTGIIYQQLQHTATSFAQNTLSPHAQYEAKLVFLLALVAWYTCKIISNLSLIYAILFFYGIRHKILCWHQQEQVVLRTYIVINIGITLTFLLEYLFLTERYVIALVLTLMLWLPFVLDYLFCQWQNGKLVILFPILLLLIVLHGLGGILNFHHKKLYLRQTGEWLAKHNLTHANIYANDLQIMYYTQYFGDNIFAQYEEFSNADFIKASALKHWHKYHYLALHIPAKTPELVSKYVIASQPIQTFANSNGDQVKIYQIKS